MEELNSNKKFNINIWNSDELQERPTQIELQLNENKPLTYKELRSIVSQTLDLNFKQINIIDPKIPDIKELYDWSVQTDTEIQNLENIKVIIKHQKPNPIIIGLTGPTRSGKGTLCGYLKHSLNAEIMNLDEFYYDDNYINEKLKGNWEVYESYNWDAILTAVGQKIEECKQKDKPYLVIDSFMLFYKQHLYDICDFRFQMQIPDEEIKKRRQGYQESYEGYFENTIIPEKNKYQEYVKKHYPKQNIEILDGMKDKLEIFKKVKNILKSKFK